MKGVKKPLGAYNKLVFWSNINLFISHQLSFKHKRLIFALISGAFFSLSSPSFAYGAMTWLSLTAWISLIPLCILLKSSRDWKQASIEAGIFFLTNYLILFSWLTTLHPLDWQGLDTFTSLCISGLAWLVPSVAHSLVGLGFALVLRMFHIRKKHLGDRSLEFSFFELLLIALVWVILQHKLILNSGALGIFFVPTHLLAYSQYSNLAIIQVCNIIGAIGLEFIIVLVNLFLANFLYIRPLNPHHRPQYNKWNLKQNQLHIDNHLKHILNALCVILILGSALSYGLSELKAPNTKPNQISVKLVQALHSAAETRGHNLSAQDLFNKQYQLSKEDLSKVDLLIWSEGSIPDPSYVKANNYALSKLANNFVFGTYNQKQGQIYNSAASYQPRTQSLNYYDKQKLVPFGEYTPGYNLLPSVLQNLASSSIGSGFDAAGSDQDLLSIKSKAKMLYDLQEQKLLDQEQDIKFATLICFELLFPDLVRQEVSKGAEFIVNLNDLSWFKWGTIKRSFRAVGVLRAVETSKDLLMVSNAGNSAHINSSGQLKSLDSKVGSLNSKLNTQIKPSLFTNYGW